MRRVFWLLILAVLCAALWGCVSSQKNTDVLFQTSTINALLEGVYDGDLTCGDLRRHGDMGIGTFNGLDGEMVMLDGKVYQIRADGTAYLVNGLVRTPFAAVTFFEPDHELTLEDVEDYEQLQERLDVVLPTKNIFYGFRIEGVFNYVKTRSVPRQTRPYPRLVEVVKNQPTFELRDVKGTIVGFRLPTYLKEVNVPGYHFHFISSDGKSGGHLLECQAEKISVGVDYTTELHMVLPKGGDFYSAALDNAERGEMEKVEK